MNERLEDVQLKEVGPEDIGFYFPPTSADMTRARGNPSIDPPLGSSWTWLCSQTGERSRRGCACQIVFGLPGAVTFLNYRLPNDALPERGFERTRFESSYGISVGKEEAMDTSEKTTPSGEMSMGRPSDEVTLEEDDEREANNLIRPNDFEEHGSEHELLRNAVDSWLEHEAELVRPIHITMSDSSDALTIRADVPGVKEEDLNIKVEPSRVKISRRPISKIGIRTLYSASHSDTATRVIDLPEAVTVNKVRIAVRDGVLELDLAKAEPIKHESAQPNTP